MLYKTRVRLKIVLIALSLFVFVNTAFADVCVWRDPERTMIKLFPHAEDYKTLVYKLTSDQIHNIESLFGKSLDDSEKHEFNIYAINQSGKIIGWVMALAGTGEYGVIETVIGLNSDHSIRGVYLQRVRERKRKALKSDSFLNQFDGKKQGSEFNITAITGAEKASNEITLLIKKMLAFDAVLNVIPANSKPL